jgi:hypothetical protein
MKSISRIGSGDEKSIRFLGLMIDPDLKYTDHCKKIRNKISSGLYFLRRAKNFLSHQGMKSLYYSLIHSHLIYAIQVWSATSKSNITTLFRLQKQAIRIVHNTSYNAHTESLFKKSKILPLPKLIEFFQMQCMQHYVNGHLPSAFNDMAITNEAYREFCNSGASRYQLRNNDDIYLPFARLTSTEVAPFYIFPRIWSNFGEMDIKIIRSKTEFNTKLKAFFLKELDENFICNRLLCPNCHLRDLSSVSSNNSSNSSNEND